MHKIKMLQTGTTVRFSTYDLVDDTNSFEGVIAGTIDGRYLPFPATALAQHANIYPTLPPEIKLTTPNNFAAYEYLIFKNKNGNVQYIGLPWIIEASVVGIMNKQFTVVCRAADDIDGTYLRRLLEQNRIEVVSIA
jgi:hypothetical protein